MLTLTRCKLYHKTTWFETFDPALPSQPSFLVANYITKLRGLKLKERVLKYACKAVANYITKLRGLKHHATFKRKDKQKGCKLYHKTTWFETLEI